MNSVPVEFLDSNVLVYAFTTDRRAEAAQRVIERGCVTSVQVLNEFANVARRKLAMNWGEVREALAAIRIVCRAIVPLTLDTHADALRIAQRYGCAIFDALIVAAALQANSQTLWSEDMQQSAIIDGRLRIANPLLASPHR